MEELNRDEYGRPRPPQNGTEISSLLGFLEHQRATTAWKTHAVSDEGLAKALHPTSMTLGGLLKHLAYVEDYWFTRIVGLQNPPEPWASVDWEADADWDWNSAANDTGHELRELWGEAIARSNSLIKEKLAAEPDSLGELYWAWGGKGQASIRWILLHMIEEYARHNGHADLLRQAVDGMTGE